MNASTIVEIVMAMPATTLTTSHGTTTRPISIFRMSMARVVFSNIRRRSTNNVAE